MSATSEPARSRGSRAFSGRPTKNPEASNTAHHARRRKNKTASQLREAAARIGAAKPLSLITVDDITREAGVSRPTFYLYYANKDDIYLQLVNEVCDRLYAAAGNSWAGRTPRDSILTGTTGYVRIFFENRDIMRLLMTAAHSDDRFGLILNEVRQRFLERIERNIRKGIAEDIFRPVEPALAARALGGMVEWYCVSELFRGDPIDVDLSSRILADLWFHAIDGSSS